MVIPSACRAIYPTSGTRIFSSVYLKTGKHEQSNLVGQVATTNLVTSYAKNKGTKVKDNLIGQ